MCFALPGRCRQLGYLLNSIICQKAAWVYRHRIRGLVDRVSVAIDFRKLRRAGRAVGFAKAKVVSVGRQFPPSLLTLTITYVLANIFGSNTLSFVEPVSAILLQNFTEISLVSAANHNSNE